MTRGGWIGSLQNSETNAAVKTPVGTTDAVPELPRGRYFRYWAMLTAYIRIKVQLDLQADKSPVVVNGPFFPQVWTQGIESVEQMCDARINLIKVRTLIFKGESYASNLENIMKMILIYENWR
jgi:hypothetical protein